MNNINEEIEKLNPEQQKELFKGIIRNLIEEKAKADSYPETYKNLKILKEEYEKEYSFTEGQIIRWKNKMKNRALPEYNEPVIILEVLETPLKDDGERLSSTYYNELFDIKVGIMKDDTFLTFYFDSRRFEPFDVSE